SQCSGDEPHDAYAATGYFFASKCVWTASPNFPTDIESPTMRMLGGAGSGGGLGCFDLPSATRTKLTTPTIKASGKATDCSRGDQTFLASIFRVFSFILDP